MRRSSTDVTPPSKKTKLGPSASAYPRSSFVAKPSQWSYDREAAHLDFHNRRLAPTTPFRPEFSSPPVASAPRRGPTELALRLRSPAIPRPRPRTPLAPPDRHTTTDRDHAVRELRPMTVSHRPPRPVAWCNSASSVSSHPWSRFRQSRYRTSTRLSRASPNHASPMP